MNANEAGEWNLDMLKEDWNLDELEDWGLDLDFDIEEAEEESLSKKNKEININSLEDKCIIKLEYNQEDFYKIIEKLNNIRVGNTNEDIIYNLLIKDNE